MKKRCLAALLTMTLLFGMVGCQGTSNPDTPVATSAPEATATVAPDPTDATETKPTEVPEATETPMQVEPTEEPVQTQEPETTATPEVVATPEPTATPKSTATPKPTNAPTPKPEKYTDAALFKYSVKDDGTIRIDGTTAYIPGEVRIPKEIDGRQVTEIGCMSMDINGDGARDKNRLTERVVIPFGVTKIGMEAFLLFESLTDVEIPSSVTVIGDAAFGLCDKLAEVTVPSSVKEIGFGAFNSCSEEAYLTYEFRMYVERGSYAEKWCMEQPWGCPAYDVKTGKEIEPPKTTPTPSPTPRPTLPPSQEELWQAKYEADEFPKDTAWIDDLYHKLITDDYQGVLEYLKDDSIFEKAMPYHYTEYDDYNYGCRLVTSDGNFVGLYFPRDISNTWSRHAWYSEGHDGFPCTMRGDKEVIYYPKPWMGLTYEWFDGVRSHGSDGSVSSEYERNQCFYIREPN